MSNLLRIPLRHDRMRIMTSLTRIAEFFVPLENSLSDGSFVKLSLELYTGDEPNLKAVYIRKILIKREEKLSFTYHYKTRDIVKNYAIDDGLSRVRAGLSNEFQAAKLCTTGFDLVLDQNKIKQKPPSHSGPVSVDHDRSKNRFIATKDKAYLHALNITDEKGNVFKNAQDKYRQINKYVEILDGVIKNIPAERFQKVVDMGAGKGYLTFALADHIQGLGISARVTGVEYRADLVDVCNNIAHNTGFSHLDFVQGSIASFDSAGVSLLIALHACDTATDDAIAKGILAGADAIVVAPCCHKQIRREMEQGKTAQDLDVLMAHGIFIERQAEMVTDALRALIMEYFGYTTKVFEFISDAHTPKNVMIVGMKRKESGLRDPAVLAKIKAAKEFFGITIHHLEKMLGI